MHKIDRADTDLARLLLANRADHKVEIDHPAFGPELAAEALARLDSRQRKLRPSHVDFLARQLTEGRWIPDMAEPIAFSKEEDALMNGMHRCQAIILTQTLIPATLWFNVPSSWYAHFDYGGLPRTLADITGIDRKAVEPVAYLYREGNLRKKAGGRKLAAEDFEPYWQTFGELAINLQTFCGQSRRGLSSAPVKAATIFLAKRSGDDTVPFHAYRSLILQDYRMMPPSLQSLNRQFLDSRRGSTTERFVRTIVAMEKHENQRVQVRDVLAKAADIRQDILELVAAQRKMIWKLRERPDEP